VKPVAGRLLLFSSGPENYHAVRRVTHGARFVLAMWWATDTEAAARVQRALSAYNDGSSWKQRLNR